MRDAWLRDLGSRFDAGDARERLWAHAIAALSQGRLSDEWLGVIRALRARDPAFPPGGLVLASALLLKGDAVAALQSLHDCETSVHAEVRVQAKLLRDAISAAIERPTAATE